MAIRGKLKIKTETLKRKNGNRNLRLGEPGARLASRFASELVNALVFAVFYSRA